MVSTPSGEDYIWYTRVIPKVMSNHFLHANREQQMKESMVVDGTSCCVILECLVTSVACITWPVSLLTKWPTTICCFASMLSSNFSLKRKSLLQKFTTDFSVLMEVCAWVRAVFEDGWNILKMGTWASKISLRARAVALEQPQLNATREWMRSFKMTGVWLDTIARTLGLGHNAVQEMIESLGYRKVCVCWVPRLLSEDHKLQRKAITSELLQRFYRRGIFKLTERWDKCVQRSGDYVEK